MRGIPEELFQVFSSDGRVTLIAAARMGLNVGLFACTPKGDAVEIAPTEARDLAAELTRLADEAESRSDGEPRAEEEHGGKGGGGGDVQARGQHEGGRS